MELYEVLALYLNHFKPVRRQISRERVGSKYIRKYEKIALTPSQRMLGGKDVSDEVKEKLRQEHMALNPLTLKRKIDTIVHKINQQQSRHKNGNHGKCRE